MITKTLQTLSIVSNEQATLYMTNEERDNPIKIGGMFGKAKTVKVEMMQKKRERVKNLSGTVYRTCTELDLLELQDIK